MKKVPLSMLSEQYLTVLRLYFQDDAPGNLSAANKFGCQAVALGLETLELAKIHDQALETMVALVGSPARKEDLAARGAIFFAEACAPIEKTHRSAREAGAGMDKLSAKLADQTRDLAESSRDLQEGIARRETADQDLQTSQDRAAALLEESRKLQKHLQDMTHQILTSHEGERKAMSLQLQDEIAQTLLAINIHLAALKKEISLSHTDFKKEIAITQRLVGESVKTINRFALEFALPHEN